MSESLLENLPNLVKGCYSDDPKQNFKSCQQIRRLLSIQTHPPIDEVIKTGILPRLIQFVSQKKHEKLQFEALWALNNISSGKPEHTEIVVKNGGISAVINAISKTSNHEILEQSIWTIGNIIGESPQLRDLVLKSNGLHKILNKLKFWDKTKFTTFEVLLKYEIDNENMILNEISHLIYDYYFDFGYSISPISVLRIFAWTLSNFCRGKPGPELKYIKLMIPPLSDLLFHNDNEIIQDICWGFSYLSDFDDSEYDTKKELLIANSDCVKRLIKLLSHPNPNIEHPALRTLGNLVTSTNNDIIEHVINNGIIPLLEPLLKQDKGFIRKEACWTLSNITASNNYSYIGVIISNDLFHIVISMLHSENERFETKKEGCWVLGNATNGNDNQLQFLISIGAVNALCSMLSTNNLPTLMVCMEGLFNLLKFGEREKTNSNDKNKVAVFIEECGGLDKLESVLERIENDKITNKAKALVANYF